MLDKIKESCNYVVDNMEYLKINYSVLDKFIEEIDCSNLKHWLSNNPYGLLDNDIEFIINFLLVFEAIDYSFWGENKWTIDTIEGKKDGSDALLYCLLNYTKKNGYDFSDMSLLDFKDIFKGNVEIPLINDRYNTLVNVSRIVNDKMNGNFYQYIKGISNDIELFNLIIDNFSSFKDEREYNGKCIYFYKLAQLLVSDILHMRELKENISVDYSHLLGCADYKIPQVMRALGIIEYNDEIANIVDNKIEMEIGSKYEVEIRASMIGVICYIKNKLSKYNAIDINDYFFTSSKKVKNNIRPYHLCRNCNY